MQSTALTVADYLQQLPPERLPFMEALRDTLNKHLPKGFVEEMNYGMIGYVVPHKIYPDGYHCNPKQALPFINIASQKNFIALYHMGLYASPTLLQWFTDEYPKHSKTKLDMGKSCIRFKKPQDIPLPLIAALAKQMSVQDWINLYEANYKK